MTALDSKTCARCGRSFAWRKKWARCWDQVKFCSDRCRRQKTSSIDRDLEAIILELLAARAADATICPSEAARQFRPEDWRPWMEPVRNAARRLVAKGTLEILQRGQPVDPAHAKGPIRLRRRPPIADPGRSPKKPLPGGR